MKRNPPLPPPARVLQADASLGSSYPHATASMAPPGYPSTQSSDWRYGYGTSADTASAPMSTSNNDQVRSSRDYALYQGPGAWWLLFSIAVRVSCAINQIPGNDPW